MPSRSTLAVVQAIADGMGGKASVVLLAGEALLLRGGHNLPIVDEGRRAVVIKCGDPEQAHGAVLVALKTPCRRRVPLPNPARG